MTHRFRHARKDTPEALARKAEYNSKTYKAQHERDRALVKSGNAHCWRCGRHIPSTARCGPDWQSGHDDHDRTILRGPECTPCNRTAAARAGNAKQRRTTPQRHAHTRAW